MIARKALIISVLLVFVLAVASCSKNSYYYRDKETKTRNCAQPATTSHKYKK